MLGTQPLASENVLLAGTCLPINCPPIGGCPLGTHRTLPSTPLPGTNFLFYSWTPSLLDNCSQNTPNGLQKHQNSRTTVWAKTLFPKSVLGNVGWYTGNHLSLTATMTTMKVSNPLRAKRHPLPVSLHRRSSSHRSALWESEKRLASESFMIVQSKTSPARVLNVFPVRADGGRVVNMLD